MKTRLLLVPVVLVTIAALAAGCGGGGSTSVPADAVATVGSTPITKATFQSIMAVAIASAKASGQPAPTVGTSAYTALRDSAMTFLVGQEELRQEADKLGVQVTPKDVSKYVDTVKQQCCQGSEKKFNDALKQSHITLAQYELVKARPDVLGQKLQAKVTSSANVSTADAKQYYDQNKATFATPAATTRSVRHILVKNKSLANRIEQKLKQGASFASLAKKYSKDPGSAAQGGNYTATKGREVPAYDAVAFTLKNGETSPLVNATSKANGGFGWFIIQALGPVKQTAAHTQSFSQVVSEIKTRLSVQKRSLAWQNWQTKVQNDYKGKVAYQTGYTPATTTTPTVPAPATTTG